MPPKLHNFKLSNFALTKLPVLMSETNREANAPNLRANLGYFSLIAINRKFILKHAFTLLEE
jgi:hypothetical protein